MFYLGYGYNLEKGKTYDGFINSELASLLFSYFHPTFLSLNNIGVISR